MESGKADLGIDIAWLRVAFGNSAGARKKSMTVKEAKERLAEMPDDTVIEMPCAFSRSGWLEVVDLALAKSNQGDFVEVCVIEKPA